MVSPTVPSSCSWVVASCSVAVIVIPSSAARLASNRATSLPDRLTTVMGRQAQERWDFAGLAGPFAAAAFVNFAGPLAYFTFGRRRARA